MVCCFLRKFGFFQNPRVKQKTFPPLLLALTELSVCPVSGFLLMPVTRDCGHCSSWCFCQSEGGSRGLWAFGGLITVDPWWMAFDGGAFGRSFKEGNWKHVYMCIIIYIYIYIYTCLYIYIDESYYTTLFFACRAYSLYWAKGEKRHQWIFTHRSSNLPKRCDEGDGEILTWEVSKSYDRVE